MLAWRDISIKYKQSVMGFLWAILMPSLVVGAGLAVQYGLSSVRGPAGETARASRPSP